MNEDCGCLRPPSEQLRRYSKRAQEWDMKGAFGNASAFVRASLPPRARHCARDVDDTPAASWRAAHTESRASRAAELSAKQSEMARSRA